MVISPHPSFNRYMAGSTRSRLRSTSSGLSAARSRSPKDFACKMDYAGIVALVPEASAHLLYGGKHTCEGLKTQSQLGLGHLTTEKLPVRDLLQEMLR